MTPLGLYLAQRKFATEAELALRQDFRSELATLHGVQEMRHAALAERCRALVLRPRIHAALEDNALDLLYPSAKDELRDIVDPDDDLTRKVRRTLHARFYRFLDGAGKVITPPTGSQRGRTATRRKNASSPCLQCRRSSRSVICCARTRAAPQTVDEVMAMPIVSTETGDVIAALVLGFKPVEFGHDRPGSEIQSGIWLNGRLHLPALADSEQRALGNELTRALATPQSAESSLHVNDRRRRRICSSTNSLIPARSFRPDTKSRFIRWRMRSRGSNKFAGMSSSPVRPCCSSD